MLSSFARAIASRLDSFAASIVADPDRSAAPSRPSDTAFIACAAVLTIAVMTVLLAQI
jgi:hypothetical protein